MLKAPFPWFGGKAQVAHLVWERFGNTCNYVEPFAGSLATLLLRPWGPGKNETVNDRDCYLANWWRAVQHDPERVAFYADWPVNEADLHARHRWLVGQTEFRERMLHDPDFYDPRIAGWWVWGISLWIGSGWCSMPEWVGRSGVIDRKTRGIHPEKWAKRPNLHRGGNGVHRKEAQGDVWLQKPDISGDGGASGRGVHRVGLTNIKAYFCDLATRLRRVRVCCGEWDRVLGPSPTTKIGVTAVFLDPPYDPRVVRSKESGSDGAAPTDSIYAHHDNDVSAKVRTWAIEHGDDPLLRIALCGYEGEHEMPASWTVAAWKSHGGYGNQASRAGRDRERERIWFSPHCQRSSLFDGTTNKPTPERNMPRSRPATPIPTEFIQAVEKHLSNEHMDGTTRSWAPLISRSIASSALAHGMAIDQVLDWIYSAEPPRSYFDFSEWVCGAHDRISKGVCA